MLGFKDIEKQAKFFADHTTKCKCGHSLYIPKASKKQVCNWCGRMNYYDKKTEYDEKLKMIVKKGEKDENR